MSLFAGAAAYYRQYRPGIPPSVARILDAAAPQHRPRRLLDLGTGTGQAVRALLGRFDDVIASDPDADMLAMAEADLRPQLQTQVHGHIALRLVQSGAEELEVPEGWQAELVTVCRAFHWMQRAAVLDRLDRIVAPKGAVAIVSDSSFWEGPADWQAAIRHVVQEFLGTGRRAGDGTFRAPSEPFATTLDRSPFGRVEEHEVPLQRTWTSDRIIGYLFSTSFAAPHLFRDEQQRTEFAETVRARLALFSLDDTFTEDNLFQLFIARRA